MIWIVLGVALILRIIIIDQSLWLDESINVLATQQYSFWEMITKYSIGDFHPPGYFALLWAWVHLFGNSEVIVRIPSVLLGVLTVWLIYLFGKEIFNKKVALIASLFMALAPLHVYYSQEARMYSLSTFAAMLSFYSFYRLINKKTITNILTYTLSTILVLYADYLTYLILPVQFLYLVVFHRDTIKRFILPIIASLLSFLPWLTIFSQQLSVGTGAASTLPGWASVVGGAGIKELALIPIKTFLGRVSIENKSLYAMLVGSIGVLYGGILIYTFRKLDNSMKLLIGWIFIPVILAFTISFFIPVLSYFRMIFILPALYLLLAKGIDLNLNKVVGRLALVIICVISLGSLAAYYINPSFQREDWKGAVKMMDGISKDSQILFESNDLFPPFVYYSQNLSNASGGLKKVPASSFLDVLPTPDVKNIYLFEYLVDVTDPERFLEKNIEHSGYKRIETLNFNGVGFIHHYLIE